MKLTKTLFSAFAIALLSFSVSGAQTAVEGFVFGDDYVLPTRSGKPNPMRVTSSDVAWNGSGSATFRFSTNQRGTAWVVIYEKGNNATGKRMPGGAVNRLVPQDYYINTVPAGGQPIESGNSTIVWDGRDWEGNSAGSGTYEFDLVVVNNKDDLIIAGPSAGPSGFTWPNIDLTKDPPEIFVQEYDRHVPDRGHTVGDMIRGTIGTDYFANPNAWERWSYGNVFNWEGARTLSGMRQDDVNPDVYWSNEYKAPNAGIYKMTINRAAKSWDQVTDFGENGVSINVNGDRVIQFKPVGDVIYQALHGVQEVPFSAVEIRDKTSGATLTEYDVSDFYHFTRTDDDGNETTYSGGPRQLDYQKGKIVTSAWGHQGILGIDANNGDVHWMNDNGDGYGDRLDLEGAQAIGGIPSPAIHITGSTMDPKSANFTLFNMVGVNGPTTWGAIGRDGTGVFAISYPVEWGRGRPGSTRFNMINQGSDYDGLYSGIYLSFTTIDDSGSHAGNVAEGKYGPKMLSNTPYDVFSGRMGGGVTAVSANEAAGTPDSYTLGDAYPNPFNPETNIEFSVPADGHVKIDVFNSVGQLVNSIVDQDLSAGAYTATWEALDVSGNQVSSGVYFYRMEAGDFTSTRSMTLLK